MGKILKFYNKIPIWENKRRIHLLFKFRKLVENYFENIKYFDGGRIEQPKAKDTRILINRMIKEIHNIILYSGVNPKITYTPSAIAGGYVQDIDVINNIFCFGYHIPPGSIFDFIDQAIGVYEGNKIKSLLRSLNPFFYLGFVLEFIAGIPFYFIGFIGFDRNKAESSIFGYIVRSVVTFMMFIAAVLTTLSLLDYLEPVKEIIRQFFRSN